MPLSVVVVAYVFGEADMIDYLIEVAALGVTVTVIVACGVLGAFLGGLAIKAVLDFFRD